MNFDIEYPDSMKGGILFCPDWVVKHWRLPIEENDKILILEDDDSFFRVFPIGKDINPKGLAFSVSKKVALINLHKIKKPTKVNRNATRKTKKAER